MRQREQDEQGKGCVGVASTSPEGDSATDVANLAGYVGDRRAGCLGDSVPRPRRPAGFYPSAVHPGRRTRDHGESGRGVVAAVSPAPPDRRRHVFRTAVWRWPPGPDGAQPRIEDTDSLRRARHQRDQLVAVGAIAMRSRVRGRRAAGTAAGRSWPASDSGIPRASIAPASSSATKRARLG